MATVAIVLTARERVDDGIAVVEEILRRRGGLYEDEQVRLDTLRSVRSWMDEEQQHRDEIEAEAQLEAATRPDPNADTKDLFKSYRKHLKETGRAR